MPPSGAEGRGELTRSRLDLANEYNIFDEDLVWLREDHAVRGVVARVGWSHEEELAESEFAVAQQMIEAQQGAPGVEFFPPDDGTFPSAGQGSPAVEGVASGNPAHGLSQDTNAASGFTAHQLAAQLARRFPVGAEQEIVDRLNEHATSEQGVFHEFSLSRHPEQITLVRNGQIIWNLGRDSRGTATHAKGAVPVRIRGGEFDDTEFTVNFSTVLFPSGGDPLDLRFDLEVDVSLSDEVTAELQLGIRKLVISHTRATFAEEMDPSATLLEREDYEAALMHVRALEHNVQVARAASGLSQFSNIHTEELDPSIRLAPPGSAAAELVESYLKHITPCSCFAPSGQDTDNDEEEEDPEDPSSSLETRKKLRLHRTQCTGRPLENNEVHVTWDDWSESIEVVEDIEAIDRAFLFGDVVVRREGQDGQLGHVVDLRERIDLQYFEPDEGTEASEDEVPLGPLVENVSSSLLRTISKIVPDQMVTCNWWVGQVVEPLEEVVIHFDDGAVGRIESPCFQDEIEDFFGGGPTEEVLCYPGQQVTVLPFGLDRMQITETSSSRRSRPSMYGVAARRKGRVHSVGLIGATVNWRATKNIFLENPDEAPPMEMTAEELTPLNLPRSVSWQLKMRCAVDPRVRDDGLRDFENDSEESETIAVIAKLSSESFVPSPRHVAEIARTSTRVSIRWQDGSLQDDVDALDLCPAEWHMLEDELSPDEFVISRRTPDDDVASERLRRVGFVIDVDSSERTATVEWLTFDPNSGGSSYLYDEATSSREVVPIFEIELHPEFRFPLGSIVARILKEPPQLASGELSSLADVGEVTEVSKGRVRVLWADETLSWCGPDELLSFEQDLAEDFEGASGDFVDDGGDDEESPLEAFDERFADVMDGIQSSQMAAERLLGSSSTGNQASGSLVDPAPLSSNPSSSAVPSVPAVSVNTALRELRAAAQAIAEAATQTSAAPVNRSEEPHEAFAPVDEEHSATDSSMHKYRNEAGPENAQNFAAVVMREFEALENHLPAGVWVRVHEDTPWLLHALMLGPAGTPYSDVPFAFDIYLPPTYPAVPPVLHFRNVNGERMHPNLYENGKVCLSLLGTWHARDAAEVWNPQRSNVLQVLLSIQGLILGVSDPYYLEAGYEKYRGTTQAETASRHYNESVSLMALKMIPQIVAHPEMIGACFADIITWHFGRRGAAVVSRLEAYCDESHTKEEATSGGEVAELFFDQPSAGFRISLQRMLPSLRGALGQHGQQGGDDNTAS